MKTIDAVISAVAMAVLVAVLIYAMAITLQRAEPAAVTLPPAVQPAPVSPDVQRLIDEVRRLTEAPALHRIPFTGERANEKVLM